MHSALNFLSGGRQLKRLFQLSKPAPKTDESSPNRPSRLLGHRREHKWSYPSRFTEDQAGGDPNRPASSSKTSYRDVARQRQKQEDRENDDDQPEAVAVDAVRDDCIATLQRYRDSHAHVLKQIFELNEARAPMFQQTQDVVDALQDLMHLLTDFTKSVDLPDGPAAQFGELQRKFDLFRKGRFTRFRADEARRAHLEDDVIQSLFHSGRYLDGFLQTNAAGLAPLPESDIGLVFATKEDDLEQEPPERSPGDVQYLTKIGDRDIILEQLLDLRGEQAQLLEEQNSRAHFGLSLDEDSLHFLESFEEQEQALLDELEYADLGLDALKQLMMDDEALAISNEASACEPDEDEGALRYLEREMLLSQPTNHSTRREGKSLLYQEILHRKIRWVDHLCGPDRTPVDHGDLVNVWLLHRLQFLPRLLGEYTSLIETQFEEIEEDDLAHLFLERWFNDASATDFAKRRIFADQQSMQANLAESGDLEPRSLSAVPIRPTSIPLMRMGPSTTTQDIIAQAMQAQGIPS